jgi:hypothetical protein
MAISVHFKHKGFTPDKYDQAVARLDAAGHGAPAGRLNHFALDANGEIEVFDVWESPQTLEAFGPAFVPILTELGVELYPPTIWPVHNVIGS